MVSQIPSQIAQYWICALEAVLPIVFSSALSFFPVDPSGFSFVFLRLFCFLQALEKTGHALVSARALLAAVGKRRGVILGSLNIRAVSALITPAATMLVASGKWANTSVSSDICIVAGQDGGGVTGGESGGDVGGDVGGAGRSFGAGDTGGDRGRSAVSGAALYTVARKSTDSATLDRVGRSQFAYSWPEYSQVS